MLILGIETSCDDTAAAVVKDGSKVLSSVVQNQDDLHSPFGGIVPEMASRRHLEVIDSVVRRAIESSTASLEELDLISVTAGPGLVGSLLVGLSYAKGLSYATGLPLVPVDHIQGHLMTLDLAGGTPLPAVSLVSSGGHTTLYHLSVEAPPGSWVPPWMTLPARPWTRQPKCWVWDFRVAQPWRKLPWVEMHQP